MNTRVIIFTLDKCDVDGEYHRVVYDIWELKGDLRWGQIKKRLTRYNPHNPPLSAFTVRLFKAMELGMVPYQIEKVFA